MSSPPGGWCRTCGRARRRGHRPSGRPMRRGRRHALTSQPPPRFSSGRRSGGRGGCTRGAWTRSRPAMSLSSSLRCLRRGKRARASGRPSPCCARHGARPRRRDPVPGPRQGAGTAPQGGPAGNPAAHRRPRRGGPPAARARVHSAATRPRRDRDARRRARAAHVGDVDEQRGRWRVTEAVSKTRRARWVNVPPVIFQAVTELLPRDDRVVPGRRVFQGFGADRFRTAIGRACTAAGVPVFSPHDLRHRRISLLHLAGVPWAGSASTSASGTSP